MNTRPPIMPKVGSNEAQRCVNCGSTDCPRGERPCAHPMTAYDAEPPSQPAPDKP